MKRLVSRSDRSTLLLLVATSALIVAGHASAALPMVDVDFDADTPGSPPATGGVGQPTQLVVQAGSTVLVQTAANGIYTQPVVLGMATASPYASVDTSFTPVAAGAVRVEATVAFDRLAWGYFLQTSRPAAVVTRLLMTDTGAILSEAVPNTERVQVGTYAPNRPFRVRVDIDMTARTWSVAIDSKMNGFQDDPVVSGLPFLNTDPAVTPNVGQVNASLNLFPVASIAATTVAYDDITVSLLPQLNDDCSEGEWQAHGFGSPGQCIRYIKTGVDTR